MAVSNEVQKREAREPGTVERTRNIPAFLPDVDILEDNDSLILKADMPGTDEDSVDITVENNVLTVTGEVDESQHYEDKELLYHEYHIGNYERSFRLNQDVDVDKIEASVSDGVLTLTLPKTEKAKPVKIKPKSS